MPQRFDVLPFELDHIIARKHGGETNLENLALSCYPCNAHKGPNIAGIDDGTGAVIRLFHPRLDSWADHFEWAGPELIGRTPIGRVTIQVLCINSPGRVALRRALLEECVFPPASP